jgi:predicted DNA-binding protein (MmcQ/YjbR family)
VSENASLRDRLNDFALSLPEAYVEFPWGERVIKVRKKIFVFLGTDDDESRAPGMGVKLADSNAFALSFPGAKPSGYGLGKAGWVSVPLEAEGLDEDLLKEWIEESYRLVAPKRLVAAFDASH